MKENSPEQRREIARLVVDGPKKNGYPKYFSTTDEIVDAFKEYFKQESLARSSSPDDHNSQRIAAMLAEINGDMLEYHMPALIHLFKRFLTQH